MISHAFLLNHKVFDLRAYQYSQGEPSFKVFSTTLTGEGASEVQFVSFALESHPVTRHSIITLMHPETAKQVLEAVGKGHILNQVVTVTYSKARKQIVPLQIQQLSKTNEGHVVIFEFLRSLRVIDPEELLNVLENMPEQDATYFKNSTMHLPTSLDISTLPREIKSAIRRLASETLRRFWYPRVLLAQKVRFRRRLVERGLKVVAKVTPEALGKIGMFKNWPTNLSNEVLSSLQLTSFQDEFVLHEDEQAGSGIFFLASGSVQVWKKISRVGVAGRKNKAIGENKTKNNKMLTTLSGPICFGEFAFLTEEPRTATVRAIGTIDAWVLRKSDFHRIFARLPQNLVNSAIAMAFEKRNATMHISYPMTVEYLRTFALFRLCSDRFLDDLRSKLVPFAVPKKHGIFKRGESGKAMYFLRYGKCGVYQSFGNGSAEETHISTVQSGELIGDDIVLYNAHYAFSLKSLTNCDLWMLSRDHFSMITNVHSLDHELMKSTARADREKKLLLQAQRFREFIDYLPIVPSLVSQFVFKDLVSKFVPKVYKPRYVICSTAHFADRIIILTKGTVRVGTDGEWAHGECVGYTCIVPHRWSQRCMTNEIVEVLELRLSDYEEFLRTHGIYQRMLTLVTALLFPRASREEDVTQALVQTQSLKTPIMYPVSLSYRVNPHEYPFGPIPANEHGAVTAASSEDRQQAYLNRMTAKSKKGKGSPRGDVKEETKVPSPKKQPLYTNHRNVSSNPPRPDSCLVHGAGGIRALLGTRPASSSASTPMPRTEWSARPDTGTGARRVGTSKFPSWTRGGMIIMKRQMV